MPIAPYVGALSWVASHSLLTGALASGACILLHLGFELYSDWLESERHQISTICNGHRSGADEAC